MVKPTNRAIKRAIWFEYNRIANHFTDIEKEFYTLLFDENNTYSYEYLYRIFLELFLKEADFVERVQKPKYFSINREYFHDMMYPIETQLS